MKQALLTKKEQIGLYYLIKYPDFNDRELAEATNLKLSTVTAIRRRLKRRGYYYTEHLDTERLLGRFGLPRKSFYMVSDPNSEITLNMACNYTDIRRDIEAFQQYFSFHDMLEESHWNTVIFPYRLTDIINYFDHSRIVQCAFDLNLKPADGGTAPSEPTDVQKLSSKERKVFKTLVTNPELSDSQIAEKAGVSRQAVSAMKKRFLEDGLVENRRILNLGTLGYQIISMVHQKIKIGMPEKERERLVRRVSAEMPAFLFVAGATEFVMMTAHSDFQDYTESMTAYSTMMKSSGFSFENPVRIILSVPGMTEIRKHDYANIVDQMLERGD